MPKIFVNTDNSTSKIYMAGKVGKSAAAAEKKMQDVVKALVAKAPDFTADKSVAAKGYTIRIEVTNVATAGGKTTYTVHPEIVRFPSTPGKGAKGAEMVSTLTKDPSITVEGTSEGLLLDGIETVTENIVTKSLPLMKIDMLKR